MDKTQILNTLDLLAEKIEQKFNIKILRKLMAPKGGTMFLTMYPIDNSKLNGKENNIFGPNVPKLKSFDDNDVNVICTVMIPVYNEYSEDFVIDNNLRLNKNTFNDVIKFCTNDLGIIVYDGGKIKMSYEMKDVIDTETFYCTKDSLITADIYSQLGSVAYRRIIYYI